MCDDSYSRNCHVRPSPSTSCTLASWRRTMAYRRFIPIAVLLVVFVTALAGGQGKPSLSHAEVAPFIGTWLFTMTEPEGFKGTEQTVRIWETNGVVSASVQIGKFPASDATGIFHDGDMLVLTIS